MAGDNPERLEQIGNIHFFWAHKLRRYQSGSLRVPLIILGVSASATDQASSEIFGPERLSCLHHVTAILAQKMKLTSDYVYQGRHLAKLYEEAPFRYGDPTGDVRSPF